MTSTSTQLIAGVLRQPSSVDRLHWTVPEVPFRTAQDYAATEYLYRLRLCSVQVLSSALLSALSQVCMLNGYRSEDATTNTAATSTATSLEGCAAPLHYPVQVTAQLHYMEEPLSPVVESSAVYANGVSPLSATPAAPFSSAFSAAHTLDFVFVDEWLIFPLELCDVPLDATCELDLWYNDTHLGGASFHVYSVEGELRVGQQHLTLLSHPTATSATPEVARAETDAAALLNDFHRGRFPVIPWLDALAVHQLEAREALHARSSLQDGKEAAKVALLIFHLPTATTAVFFEPSVALLSQDMLPLLTFANASGDTLHARDSGSHSNGSGGGEYTQRLFPDQYTFFKDYNLSEAKAAITSKSQYFVSESSAPPGPRERHQLASLLRRPPIQLDLGGGGSGGSSAGVGGRLEETRLLWKYRHFICKDGRFLLPFMRSVDWANTHSMERRAACALMQQWARPGFADTLACLSFYFDRVAPVRQYAVRLLRQESDARLCQVTFQLLQAVRYDTAEGELATLLLDRALGCWEMCSTLYTMLTVEVALERRRAGGPGRNTETGGEANGGDAGGGGSSGGAPRPQPRGRVAARTSPPDAIFEPLLRRLAARFTQQSPHFVTRLRQQHAMHRVLQQLSKQVQQSALDRLSKAALGNKLIAKQSCGLHALFDTLRHRAPHTSHSAALESGTAAAAATTQNSSFATDTASASQQQQQRSPHPSSSRVDEAEVREAEAAEANVEEEEEGEELGRRNVTQQTGSAASVGGSACGQRTTATANSAITTAVDVLDRYGVVTLPIYPAVPITGIVPNSLYIFKSAKLPMRLTFKAMRPAGVVGGSGVSGAATNTATALPTPASASAPFITAAAAAAAASPMCLLTPLAMQRRVPAQRTAAMSTTGRSSSTAVSGGSASPSFLEDPVGSAEEDTLPLAMMYKYDDDVRQDQLVVQLIRVMDDLLQQDGLQLYLTPYRVIATGPSEGLVEIVPHVTTFLSVQREVLKYLRVYNPTAELLRQAMDRYTRSFAGYCVITFVLGIGDRHLENILLTQDGRLLHIDFGYVFGNDPKPFPPPMKINKEMVEVLGGPQSTGFMEFKLYCCSAYNILRKHASLLLHTLLLGAHAEGMPQVTGVGGDPRVNLLKVQEKLRLDLTNAQATQYLQNVIADSVGSIFANFWDVLHAAAQATRS